MPAQEVTDRFRKLVETRGDTLPDNHYEELSLLIEAAIDTAVAGLLEGSA